MPKPGRPKGAQPTPVNNVEASRCFRCGSTDRSDYHGITEQTFAGVSGDGKPYTHIVRKRTRCLSCGQARVDRMLEFRKA